MIFNIHVMFCPLVKQTKLSFPISSIQSTYSFDLIDCDIWGPYKIEKYSSAYYFFNYYG
jgi:hypothetical protein